jgi:hypothetical protein
MDKGKGIQMKEKTEKYLSDFINHIKKSPVLNALKDTVEQVALKTSNLKHEPLSLDSLVSGLSNETDKEILKIIKTEDIQFIGGELIVLNKSELKDHFSLDLKLYFQNKSEEIILKEKHKELELSILDEISQQELFNKGTIKYEVNEPN